MITKEKGFTLVESVLAIFIFFVLSLGVMQSVGLSYKMTQDSMLRVCAANVAQGYLEQIMGMNASTLTGGASVNLIRFTGNYINFTSTPSDTALQRFSLPIGVQTDHDTIKLMNDPATMSFVKDGTPTENPLQLTLNIQPASDADYLEIILSYTWKGADPADNYSIRGFKLSNS